ncbi:MAG: hypothetical protein K6B41_01145, partial [Butyrivibrio sp.]|nr:hypothetical protein [Butyrivibrio sp.]
MKKICASFKDNKLLFTNIILIFVGFLLALILAIFGVRSITRQDMETTTRALFEGIYTSINSELEFSAQITQTMCNDSFLQSMLDKENDISEDEFEQKIAEYLEQIRDVNNWEGAYILSTETMKYYTPDGIGKIVDPENNEYDVWVKNFINTGLEYGADMTYDEFNEQEHVIFIDRRMDVNGELKAILGCAIYLSDITDLMKKYSEEYNVDICFTDVYGETTLDEDELNLGESYYSRFYTVDMIRENQVYTEDGFIIRQYIPTLGMYLVVKNNQHVLSERFNKMLWAGLVYVLLFIIILTWFNFYHFQDEKAVLKKNVRTDYLTKISNVNGLQSNINM